jgi:hypothetical protein
MNKNFTFVHTDFYSYYTHISKNKELSISKTADLMLKELKNISDDKLIVPTYNYDFSKIKFTIIIMIIVKLVIFQSSLEINTKITDH